MTLEERVEHLDERAAIVSHLRDDAKALYATGDQRDCWMAMAIEECADGIERGEHLK